MISTNSLNCVRSLTLVVAAAAANILVEGSLHMPEQKATVCMHNWEVSNSVGVVKKCGWGLQMRVRARRLSLLGSDSLIGERQFVFRPVRWRQMGLGGLRQQLGRELEGSMATVQDTCVRQYCLSRQSFRELTADDMISSRTILATTASAESWTGETLVGAERKVEGGRSF